MYQLNIDNSYNVYIKTGIFNQLLKQLDSNCFIIYDDKLEIDVNIFNHLSLSISEEAKNLNLVTYIYDQLIDNNINKQTTIIAIGGGVLLDVVGFVASTYMRGIGVVYVPTTLLSMVDACIGGKTGFNYQELKNYIGSFYNPIAVAIDPQFLETLDKRQFNNGMAEVIKYGCIKDKNILNTILNDDWDIEAVIYQCLMIKKYFIEIDPYNQNLRHALNFGHTYGHAIESYYHFQKYLHGEAVSIGMNLKCDDPLLKACCEKYDLPTSLEEDINLDDLLLKDKKNTNKINFVRLKQLGEVDETTTS